MAITITWKERGQAFAGSFAPETVEAQFKDAVVRTAKDVLTIPYECVTSVKNGEDEAVSGSFNQVKFAEAIGIDFPVDQKLATVRLVYGKEVAKKLQIVGESELQVVAKGEKVDGEKAVFSVKFLDEAEATDFEAEGAEVKENGTIVVDEVEEDTDVVITLAGESSGSGSNA
jgi:hypothetical protein